MNLESQNISDRKIYFDIMRIIAIFFVIFNHLPGYTLYQISSGYKQWIYMLITMITRINVPLFFMVSGALLLGRDENWQTILQKRIGRFLLVIFIFEFGLYLEYALISWYRNGELIFSLKTFILSMFAGNLSGTGSYWYLYSYLGMLFTLPFLRRIAQKMTHADFWILIIMHFLIASFIPGINPFLEHLNIGTLSITGHFSIPFATGKQLLYPLLGYYLEHNVNIKNLDKNKIYVLLSITFLGIFISSVYTYYEGETKGIYTQNYVQMFDYITTICVFLLTKKHFFMSTLSQNKMGPIVTLCGSLSFGIYLLDPFLKYILWNRVNNYLEPYLTTLMVSISWILITFFLGGSITLVLKKIPLIRKLL